MASLRPLLKASLTSGSMMTLGDLCCQSIQQANRPHSKPMRYDWQRAARFGIVGLSLHGPFFSMGFKALDRIYGHATSLRTAVAKTATGQVTLFPVYLSSFYTYITLLEGKTLQDGMDKISSSFAPTFLHGTAYWSCVNMINFTTIPPSGRILYVNICGLLWSIYLSWTNETKELTL